MIRAGYYDLAGSAPLPRADLPAALLAHIARYRMPNDRRRSMAAWSLLWRLLPAPECPSFSERGMPCLPDLYLSLAHSKNMAAAAVSDCPVGIDIEQIASRPIAHLAEKCLTRAEYAVFSAASDQTLCFYMHWTAKEAYAKLTGAGLQGYPLQIELYPDSSVGALRVPAVHRVIAAGDCTRYCLCVAGTQAPFLKYEEF